MLDSKAYACVNDKFPRVAAAIKLFWGNPELVKYIDGLLLDTHRGGTRQGFPVDVVISLNELLDRHHAEFPKLAPSGMGIWVANNKVL